MAYKSSRTKSQKHTSRSFHWSSVLSVIIFYIQPPCKHFSREAGLTLRDTFVEFRWCNGTCMVSSADTPAAARVHA
jgi:hypothetical protein